MCRFSHFVLASALVFMASQPILCAQSKFTVKGTIIDKETSEALMGANVQLLSLPDSTLVTGVMADDMGAFTFHNVGKGKYAMKFSFIGYISKVVALNTAEKKSHQVELGYITLLSDAKMLKEAVVETAVAKVQVVGDSMQYNAAAYPVSQGSTLESLVKLLPGAEVDDDGNITINGKSVTKILVDGKEFFLNDKSVALKNIPVDIIDKIKSYDRKSDMARITGVDDGEEETVLDLSVKKGMKHGWFGNALAGAGTAHRYNARAMVNHYNDNANVSVLGNGRNVPERQGWNRSNGLNSHKEGGMNFASKNTNMETGGSVTYKYDGADHFNLGNSHDLRASEASYSMSRSQTYTSNHGLEAQFKMEWRPDTMTTILFRPNFTYRSDNSMKSNRSGSYNIEVANYTDDEIEAMTDVIVNKSMDRSQSHNSTTNTSGELQVTRKLNDKGRNITLRLDGNYTTGESQSLSAAFVDFRKENSTLYNNRYYDTPSRNYNLTGRVSWNEPIADRLYLQMTYRYSYGYSKNDRQAFVYDSEAYNDLVNQLTACRYDVDEVLRIMRESNYMLRDTVALSQFSEYRNYNQRIRLQLRQVRDFYNFTIGIDAIPQRTTLDYRYMGHEYPKVSRQVFNVAPRVNLRMNFSKTTNLQVRYNSRTNQPSMINLLDIVDDSNPLNISVGNPGLKPSFSHNWNANYNSYKPETQRGLWSWIFGTTTRNSIGNKITYYKGTGKRSTKPVNINGNWNMGGGVGMNIGLGKEKKYTVGGNVGGSFTNNVGYYNNISLGEADDRTLKTITKRSNYNLGLRTAYRNESLSIELRGNLNGTRATNNEDTSTNYNIQEFWYGTDFKWIMPWGTELATDLRMNSRRGYTQSEMNSDELLWNASISQSFLKGNALTVKAEAFDILGQQTNVSRTIGASYIADSRTNAIYQYGMISLIYRFSVFAGRNTMGTSQERR